MDASKVKKETHPETLHHLLPVNTKLLGVPRGELTDGEGPAVETGAEGDGTLVGVDLDIAERLVEVGGDDDVDGLDGTREGLVEVLLGDLELEKSTVDLVDDDDGLDALTESLAEHSLGLDAHTLDGVDDDEGTVGDTEGSSDLRGEINVTGRVDEVDKEVGVGDLLGTGNVLQILLREGGVQGDGGRLDGDTTLLLVGSRIRGTGISSLGGGDNTGLGEKGVGEGRLAVIDVGNDRHVTDIGRLVHEPTDLVDREAIIADVLAAIAKGSSSTVILDRGTAISMQSSWFHRLQAAQASLFCERARDKDSLSSSSLTATSPNNPSKRPQGTKRTGSHNSDSRKKLNSLDHFGGIVRRRFRS